MKSLSFLQSSWQSLVLTVLVLALLNIASAQVRSSTNYQLQSDSINVGGGFSSSTSYIQESTVGETATGLSASASYSLRAGYQQMQEVFLSLASTGNVVMSPNISGLTGGLSNGQSTFTVTTDSPAGYQLLVAAEGDPAMQSGANSIADYDPGATPSFFFTYGAADAFFGFSPEGVDIVQLFMDDGGGNCNVSAIDTANACWDGLANTSQLIAEGSGANHPNGATTTVKFRTGVGGAAGVVAGVYVATTTVTALPL